MSERMDNAMLLGERCWARAMEASPAFVAQYLAVSEALLLSQPDVTGDLFKRACDLSQIRLPDGLHHNVWVSGPKSLKSIGWIEEIDTVIPTSPHNHMRSVTRWRSLLYTSP